jgi:hypothetical protein
MSLLEVLVFLSPILILVWLFLFLLGMIPYQLFLLPVLLLILAATVGEYRTWRSNGSKLSFFSFLLNLSITLSGMALLATHPEDVTSTPLFRVWSILIYLSVILSESRELISQKPVGKQKYGKIFLLILLGIGLLFQLQIL